MKLTIEEVNGQTYVYFEHEGHNDFCITDHVIPMSVYDILRFARHRVDDFYDNAKTYEDEQKWEKADEGLTDVIHMAFLYGKSLEELKTLRKENHDRQWKHYETMGNDEYCTRLFEEIQTIDSIIKWKEGDKND